MAKKSKAQISLSPEEAERAHAFHRKVREGQAKYLSCSRKNYRQILHAWPEAFLVYFEGKKAFLGYPTEGDYAVSSNSEAKRLLTLALEKCSHKQLKRNLQKEKTRVTKRLRSRLGLGSISQRFRVGLLTGNGLASRKERAQFRSMWPENPFQT